MENRMKRELVAPCGMNCRLCVAYVRKKNPCPGCRGADEGKPRHCVACAIKNCEIIGRSESGLCGDAVLFEGR